MTGNDIVDLKQAATESNWQRKGFLEKIFTPLEQSYIAEAVVQEQMVWKLWSMKESAYKIYTRQYGGRFFAPQQLKCVLLAGQLGKVCINNLTYQTSTIVTKNYIYSIARTKNSENPVFFSHSFRIPEVDQDKFVYKKIISVYAEAWQKQKEYLTLIKDINGAPLLYSKKERSKIPVSITHHGRYAAFTIY